MNYRLKGDAMSALFMVPTAIVDKHLKLASDTQLKVLLFVLRNISSGIDPELTAKGLCIPLSEVNDALLFWQQCGIFEGEQTVEQPPKKEEKNIVRRAEKPSRSDVAHRGAEDEKIMFLLREAQLKFGRNLKTNESSTLVWLYDDEGMDVSLILMLIQYAISEKKCNISFIERTAAQWLDNGVETVADAEKYIAESAKKKLSWGVVQSAFGIENRRPSAKELTLSDTWINEWKITPDLLRLAYDACVDAKSKFLFSYTAKIIEEWHKKGIKTPDELKAQATASAQSSKPGGKKYDYAAYDLELFERMLDEDDE